MTSKEPKGHIHFTSGGYLVIKTAERRQLSVPSDNVQGARDELIERIKKMQGQVATLNLYLDGKTTCDPEALR